MTRFSVGYYQTNRGSEPVFDFVAEQDEATRAKINRFIGLLEIYGPNLGMPHARKLKAGLYELRVRGKNEIRIFYVTLLNQNKIIFIHAFNKRSQKLPTRELSLAQKRQKELTGL